MAKNNQNADKVLRIECEAKENVPFEQFRDLQGELKTLSEPDFNKLKESLLEFGFSFPIFCWKNKNIKWIIDAHQRLKVIKHLKEVEGYKIPNLPTAYIFAKNKKEAETKLLILNSQYGKTTQESVAKYIEEREIDVKEYGNLFEIPNYNIDTENTNRKIVKFEAKIKSKFEVIIECESEKEQEKIYNELKKDFKVRKSNH